MPKNAYLLAKIGADTAENERNLAKNQTKKIGNYPIPLVPAPRQARRAHWGPWDALREARPDSVPGKAR